MLLDVELGVERGILAEVDVGDGAGDLGGIGDGLDHGRRTAAAVTGGPDALDAGRHAGGRTAAAVDLDAGALVQRAVDALAHGADDRGRGDLDRLARRLRAAAAGGVGLTELHDVAGQHAVDIGLGREQLAELDALG